MVITGNTSDLTGAAKKSTLTFTSSSRASATALALNTPVVASAGANGEFTTPNILPGSYELNVKWDGQRIGKTFSYRTGRFHVVIPDEAGPLDILEVLVPQSSSQAWGYSQSQVDALLAALVAGGAGAPSGTPTGTQIYWDRTNSALYVGDNSTWTKLLQL